MLGWIFRKKGVESGSAHAAASTSPPVAVAAPEVDWTAALARAHGDNAALLALALTSGTPLQFKQAAVAALDGEAALKVAEREFRRHDRRVHQLAKQRLQAQVAQRQTREQAARLLESARNLAGVVGVPANRLVELDRAWQALDAAAIEPKQREDFASLTAELATQLQRGADIELRRKRWQADAVAAQRQLQLACTEAAAGTQDREHLAAAMNAARGVAGALPPDEEADPTTAGALAALEQAVRIATSLDGHLAVLLRLLAGSNETPPAAAADATPDPDPETSAQAEGAAVAGAEIDQQVAVLPPAFDNPQREWQALAPLADVQLAALLQARHARWQQAGDQAQQARRLQGREAASERQRARRGERALALADGLAQAEAALDAGKLADAQGLLGDIDDQLRGADAPVALQTRIATAQARLAQLRGWQQWAGWRARDELVLQAEALAAATVTTAATVTASDGRAGGPSDAGGAVVAEVAQLSIRQRADLIQTLRQRWKEIDKLGGAGGQALWRRFDAALAAAGEPVAAHAAAQRATRLANLSARRQLLEVLEAAGAAAAPGPAAAAGLPVPQDEDDLAPLQTQPEAPADPPGDARRWASALDRFHSEWRKLGPLAHTVPREAQAGLSLRMAAAVRRLDLPLQAARARAADQRQALVTRARALTLSPGSDGPGRGRDLAAEVRALQADWQQHATALPLARADEQALWADFKAATAAAFAAREAAYSAREAEFEAHAAERTALIERLRPPADGDPVTQRRLLAEIDLAWQRCGPAPRARAAALDAEFRAARDGLQRWLDDSAQRAWQASCDALDAKVALCLARERQAAAGADLDMSANTAAWSTLARLPAPLEDALRRRAGLVPADGSGAAHEVDELLLQIETAWALPTPPAFETARRERKLLAMKQALEGRRSLAPEPLPPLAALALLLSRASLDAGQHERLAAVLAAWRRQGPQR